MLTISGVEEGMRANERRDGTGVLGRLPPRKDGGGTSGDARDAHHAVAP